ncbi:hypothetical protein BB559_002516 [Furculomyces boomerangus]|uniref:Uncharacterized protein n=1 Tax=Furculomyces boomerangus TaxID=61424 RepID=A0A2T9YUR7_9FUNG|nr:hypothetical protein BB559_002516 [Furculomyces boomerangus]
MEIHIDKPSHSQNLLHPSSPFLPDLFLWTDSKKEIHAQQQKPLIVPSLKRAGQALTDAFKRIKISQTPTIKPLSIKKAHSNSSISSMSSSFSRIFHKIHKSIQYDKTFGKGSEPIETPNYNKYLALCLDNIKLSVQNKNIFLSHYVLKIGNRACIIPISGACFLTTIISQVMGSENSAILLIFTKESHQSIYESAEMFQSPISRQQPGGDMKHSATIYQYEMQDVDRVSTISREYNMAGQIPINFEHSIGNGRDHVIRTSLRNFGSKTKLLKIKISFSFKFKILNYKPQTTPPQISIDFNNHTTFNPFFQFGFDDPGIPDSLIVDKTPKYKSSSIFDSNTLINSTNNSLDQPIHCYLNASTKCNEFVKASIYP